MSKHRKTLAVVAGLLCAAPVMTFSLGEVFIASGHPAAAAALPGNAPLLARRVLGKYVDDGQARAASRLALRALRASPLNQSALAWLSIAPPATAMTVTDRNVLFHEAAAQGWRDGFAQRTLYNQAVLRNDCSQALLHATALMRQNVLVDQVESNLALAARQPECRATLVRLIADGQPWTRAWLLRFGASLDADVLTDLLVAADRPTPGMFRQIAAPILQQLVARNDIPAALRIWNVMPGHDGDDAIGLLAWPTDAALSAPTPLDWRVSEGYEIRGQRDHAILQRSTVTRQAGRRAAYGAARMLALPPGSYVLLAGTTSLAWSWNISCSAQGTAPTAPLRRSNPFTVPAKCPRQWLALAALDDSVIAAGPTLAPLRIGLNR